jgi:hypothetical protein
MKCLMRTSSVKVLLLAIALQLPLHSYRSKNLSYMAFASKNAETRLLLMARVDTP